MLNILHLKISMLNILHRHRERGFSKIQKEDRQEKEDIMSNNRLNLPACQEVICSELFIPFPARVNFKYI